MLPTSSFIFLRLPRQLKLIEKKKSPENNAHENSGFQLNTFCLFKITHYSSADVLMHARWVICSSCHIHQKSWRRVRGFRLSRLLTRQRLSTEKTLSNRRRMYRWMHCFPFMFLLSWLPVQPNIRLGSELQFIPSKI